MVLKQGTKHKEKGNDLKRFGTCFKNTGSMWQGEKVGDNYKRERR